MQVGDPDGYGHYGVLDVDEDGCLCVDCGWRGLHLGLHVFKAHGMRAAAYKQKHGLRRSRGLVAESTRRAQSANAAARYPTNLPLQESRDPAAASAARHRLGLEVAAEAADLRDRRMADIARASRLGIVVVCAECSSEFCPLASARRRRFCSRSCASRFNRRGARGPG